MVKKEYAFFTDQNKRLIHTISDGDIRRALIRGLNLKDKITKLRLRKPTAIKKGSVSMKLKKNLIQE